MNVIAPESTESVETPPAAEAIEEPAEQELPVGAPEESSDTPALRHARLARVALVTWVVAGGILLSLVLVIAGFQIAERDQIRAGVHAFGVDLSGMTREQALAVLTEASEARANETLLLVDGGNRWTLREADLGVRMDVEGAIDDAFAAGRHGWGPSRLAVLWHLRSEPDNVAATRVGVDSTALNGELLNLKHAIDQPKIEAELAITDEAGIRYVHSQVGRALDVKQTREQILAALAIGQSRVSLVVDETQPTNSDADFAAARKQLNRILDAPIDLVAIDQTWTLTPAQIAYWMDLKPPAGSRPAEVKIDEQWVTDVVTEIAGGVDRLPHSPRVWWAGGGGLQQIQPGTDGRTLDQGKAREMVHAAFLGETDGNTVDLPVSVQSMTALPADLNSLGISNEIGEASTPYGGSLPARMHNIELAASRLNGTLVMPGQTFSFNGEIGSTSIEAGFEVAYGIASDNGTLSTVPAVAGGICQVATTVFQPVFWAGYEIVERNTHSYWISRYSSNGYVGLDATVDEATNLDFRWTNNSPYAVLIEAATDGENFTVRLYGSLPPWRVEVDAPVITNEKKADDRTHYEPTSDLPNGSTREVEHAADGFDVSITRRVIEGDQVRSAEFVAEYGISRNVVLVGSSDGTLPPEYEALNNPEVVTDESSVDSSGEIDTTDGSGGDTAPDETTTNSDTTDGTDATVSDPLGVDPTPTE